MVLSRGTTAATDDQTPAAAKITSAEKRVGFFVKRLLTVRHHTESLLSFVELFGRVTRRSLPRI
jgi:hypothetical protein